MDKQEFLKFVQDLPEDLYVTDFNLHEWQKSQSEWKSCNELSPNGGVYEKDVQNELTLHLHFKTRYKGEFRRTYIDPDGSFSNIQRIK